MVARTRCECSCCEVHDKHTQSVGVTDLAKVRLVLLWHQSTCVHRGSICKQMKCSQTHIMKRHWKCCASFFSNFQTLPDFANISSFTRWGFFRGGDTKVCLWFYVNHTKVCKSHKKCLRRPEIIVADRKKLGLITASQTPSWFWFLLLWLAQFLLSPKKTHTESLILPS